jgi:hypothetical protein
MTVRGGLPVQQAAGPQLASGLVAAALGAVAVMLSLRYTGGSLLMPLAVVLVASAATWSFFSERHELTLAVLMLYLGLLDGYLKLKTGSSKATLARDVLLYALVLGILVRGMVRRTPVAVPPLSGWVLAWVLVVLVQIFNPANPSIPHGLGSARPHLEWVPLFFLGYMTMRSARRLRAFLLLLVLVAAVNGVVSVVQYQLTPEQFAAWGPGYSERIAGTGDVAARGFEDAAGEARTRPFGLGSDFGFGGSVGLLAAPAALALLALARRQRWLTAITVLAAAGTVLAIVMSQARVAVIGSVVAVVAYAALATAARRLVPTLAALGIAVLIGVAVISNLGSGATQGSFDRYSDITPTRVVGTTVSYRRDSLEALPRYVQEYPFGAGLGKVGPASEYASGGPSVTLNAEGEANYLVLELGVAGLLVLLGFNVRLLLLSGSGIRRVQDPELRLLLSALAAPLLALFAAWLVGVTSATTPTSPYFWFVAGVLAYWLAGRSEPASATAAPAVERQPARPPPAETAIGGYRLDQRVRKAPGGGWIHRATRLSDGGGVALELVDLGHADRGNGFMERARARAALRHPCAVVVRDAGVQDGHGFLVAGLIDGATLEERLAGGALPPARALALLEPVAGALDAAHARGIVHGALAPGSILVDGPNATRAFLDACGGWCACGPMPGADTTAEELQYASPERITGARLDARSDVYSLSAVLYRCMTGAVPFPGASGPATLFWHLQAPRPRATDTRPELPRAIDVVLARGMAADPAARDPSAGALLEAAREALGAARPSWAAHALPEPADDVRRAAPSSRPAPALPWRAGEAARPSPSTPAPGILRRRVERRTARKRLASAGVVAATAIGAGAAGFAVAGALEDSPPISSRATAGRLQLTLPPGWRASADPASLAGIRLADPIAVAPNGEATGRLVAGTATTAASAALTPGLQGPGELVSLGSAQARRYRAVRLPGVAVPVTLYLAPSDRGVATVVCSPASFTPRCERVASTLRLTAGRFAPAGPSRRQSVGLVRSLQRLNATRSRARAELRRSPTAEGQAAAARTLATAHARAARALRSLGLTGLGRPGGAAAVDALERAAAADSTIAAAAGRGDRGRYARARRAALRADADLRAARRLLRRLGYGA